MDFRPVLLVVGVLLSALAVGMLVPATVDLVLDNPGWRGFVLSAIAAFFVGVCLTLANWRGGDKMTIRQAFMTTTSSWVALTVFAALPFCFSEPRMSYADAFFEAMSGITTTGSTVITGLDAAPPGILLWRSLLQWLGGIGIIVMAVAVLPILRVGGMQLFRMESSDSGEKALPRTARVASAIGVVYLTLTLIWVGLYWYAGMTPFEAFNHAMTTIATGGFSTSDNSLGQFDNAVVDYIGIGGMIVGSLPFLLYMKALQGDWRALFRDGQVRLFLSIALFAVFSTTAWLYLRNDETLYDALRFASFNIVSILTGTGYATTDYDLWGPYATALFFHIMFIGGCAGSTTCGIKVFRFQVLSAAAYSQVHHLLQPHGVFRPHYNKRPISDEVITSVLSFFFVFGCCYVLLAIGLGILGLDFLTAVSSAATAIANVGPGLGPVVGPAGNFQGFPDAAKWLMAFGMLLGRLELFTVIVLFSQSFWKD